MLCTLNAMQKIRLGEFSPHKMKNAFMGVYIVMSLSWNFPDRAEPSYEGSEPSGAEAL